MELSNTFIYSYNLELEAYISYYLDYTEDIVPYIDIYYAEDKNNIEDTQLNWIGVTQINVDTFLRLLKASDWDLSYISSMLIEKVQDEDTDNINEWTYIAESTDLDDESINELLNQQWIALANINNFSYLQNFFKEHNWQEVMKIILNKR